MSLILDLMVIVVFVIIVFTSYRKGFIRSIIELAGYLASFVVSYIFSAPLGKWIFGAFLQPIVSGQIKNYIKSNIASTATAQANGALDSSGITNFAKNIPDMFKSMLGNYNINTETLHNTITSGSQTATDALITNIINPITQIISTGIAFAVIFALCMIAVRIIASLTNGISRVPIIGTANRIGGAAVGILKSVIVLLIITTCIAVLIPVISLQKNPVINETNVSNSTIFKVIYNNNPITQMLLKK